MNLSMYSYNLISFASAATWITAVILSAWRFMYLHDKCRVDFYHALPMTDIARFKRRYFAGARVYAVALLCVIAAGLIIGSDTYSDEPLKVLMAAVLTLLFFMAAYNMAVCAFTLSNNFFLAVIICIVLGFYVDLWENVIRRMCLFEASAPFFAKVPPDISITDIYVNSLYGIFNLSAGYGDVVRLFAIAAIKLIIWCLATYMLCRHNYITRPVEDTESLIVFYSSRLLIKVMIIVPIALLMGEAARESFSDHVRLVQIIFMILAAVVVGFVVELLFSGSIRAACRRWGSTVLSVILIFIVFGFILFYEKRYNSYVPRETELDNYAVFNPLDSFYYGYNIDFEDGEAVSYIEARDFVTDHMFLADNAAILKLAAKSLKNDKESMSSPLPLQILYRLNNGSKVSRLILVDMDDDENRQLLNRIVGPAYYKAGVWQAFSMSIPDDTYVEWTSYHDLVADKYTKIGNGIDIANEICDEWRENMALYDYDHVRYDEVCGEIEIYFSGDEELKWVLPLYSDMALDKELYSDYNS